MKSSDLIKKFSYAVDSEIQAAKDRDYSLSLYKQVDFHIWRSSWGTIYTRLCDPLYEYLQLPPQRSLSVSSYSNKSSGDLEKQEVVDALDRFFSKTEMNHILDDSLATFAIIDCIFSLTGLVKSIGQTLAHKSFQVNRIDSHHQLKSLFLIANGYWKKNTNISRGDVLREIELSSFIDKYIDNTDWEKVSEITTHYPLWDVIPIGKSPDQTAQSLEFLEWIEEKYPEIDIVGNIPSEKITHLVYTFCEDKKFNNALSFSTTVQLWLQGEGKPKLIETVRDFIAQKIFKTKNNSSYINFIDRYKATPIHGMFLFLSLGDFPAFIDKYWIDLNALTSTYMDLYYSLDDLKHRVSGYQTLYNFRSLNVSVTQLPSILLWENSLIHACAVPLGNLTHDEIMGIMKSLVEGIRQEKSFNHLTSELIDEANRKIKKTNMLSKTQKYIETMIMINGENIMGDKYEISGQVGAIGPNAHAHDMTFNQITNQTTSINLLKLGDELSILRQEMRKKSKEPEHDIATGEIGKAEKAAKAKDVSATEKHLKSAGKWALDIAITIGVPVAIDALKKALGVG